MLMVGVALLVGIDLTIITLYLAVEGGRGNLLAEETSHKENPIKLEGVSCMPWGKGYRARARARACKGYSVNIPR